MADNRELTVLVYVLIEEHQIRAVGETENMENTVSNKLRCSLGLDLKYTHSIVISGFFGGNSLHRSSLHRSFLYRGSLYRGSLYRGSLYRGSLYRGSLYPGSFFGVLLYKNPLPSRIIA